MWSVLVLANSVQMQRYVRVVWMNGTTMRVNVYRCAHLDIGQVMAIIYVILVCSRAGHVKIQIGNARVVKQGT